MLSSDEEAFEQMMIKRTGVVVGSTEWKREQKTETAWQEGDSTDNR